MHCPVRSEACFLHKADYRMLPVWSTKADTLGVRECVNSPEPFTNTNVFSFSCSCGFFQYKWSPLGTNAYQSVFTPNHYPLATQLQSTLFDEKDCTQPLLNTWGSILVKTDWRPILFPLMKGVSDKKNKKKNVLSSLSFEHRQTLWNKSKSWENMHLS